ncbi:hypothetical protein SAMN02799620_02648 [Mycolicibacterium fluoranthenivorans]|uniref:Uncharacterized protein n=2 Tax=Mycolicibacterium fluoranthenivorans TaxID=258505 RepID=A0A1G4WA41_9MYCO|nr:hypothetical protein SAMN02799620_02648 [Mycolicibacterium fluoranthenivorans]
MTAAMALNWSELPKSPAGAGTYPATPQLLSVLLMHLANTPNQAAEASKPELRASQQAVERNFARTHAVTDCAATLGYSVRTLICASREATGLGAKRIIDDRANWKPNGC